MVIMASGDLAELTAIVHPEATNREAKAEPPACRGWGPAAFVAYDVRGEVAQAFPSKGRTFSINQTHWFRIREGLVGEHWANRDDLGMAPRLGWIPPTPLFLWRMARATRHARRNPVEV